MNRFHPPVNIHYTKHEKFNVSTIQHAIGWYETAVFYPNGHSRTVLNEAQNEHDAIVNHRVIVSNLAESEQSEPGMFAITIYTNDGNGDYIHPKSGTYAIVPDITVLMDVENFSRLEITPSK